MPQVSDQALLTMALLTMALLTMALLTMPQVSDQPAWRVVLFNALRSGSIREHLLPSSQVRLVSSAVVSSAIVSSALEPGPPASSVRSVSQGSCFKFLECGLSPTQV